MLMNIPELAGVDLPFASIKVDLQLEPFADLLDLHRHWLTLSRGRIAPARDEFDPTEIPPRILPKIMMVDVQHDPLDFSYRFWGTGIVDFHGVDLTGHSVMEVKPACFAEMVWQQYADVVGTKEPGLFVHNVPVRSGMLEPHAILRLPFSGDGEVVDIVMSADEYCGGRSKLKRVFEEAEIYGWEPGPLAI